ncbi:MAG: polysaccharide biosynthesis tyrosine autokinase [Pyrinomonadaceae bacterium]
MRESRELTKRVTEIQEISRAEETALPSTHSYNYGVGNADESEVHLRDYWRAIRKRLWLILGIVALLTMLSALYMARKPDIYEAGSRVQVDLERNQALGGLSKNSPIIFNSAANDPAYFNTQLQILTGPALLRRVVKTLDLEHNQEFLRPQTAQSRSTWQSLMHMIGRDDKSKGDEQAKVAEAPLTSSVAPATSRDDLTEAKRLAPFVGALQGGLTVTPVKETRTGYIKDTRLIDISYNHPNPQIAAKVVNAIADTFVLSNMEKKSETNSNTGDYLQKRIAELQLEIRNGDEKLANYSKSHEIVSLEGDQNVVAERLAGLNKELLEAENERKTAEAALNAAKAPGAIEALAGSADIESRNISNMEAKLTELRQQRAELLVDNTEAWPAVKEVEKKIADLEKQIQEARSRTSKNILTNLETHYRQTLEREDSLRKDYNAQKSQTLSQNDAAIQYRIIQQENITNKELLQQLLQRSKENEVVQAGTPNNIYVVDYALAPEFPIGPRRMRAVMLTLIASLGLSIGLALFLEYLDDTVHSTEDVERMLHLPALAVIPSAIGSARRRLLPTAGALQTRNGNGTGSNELLVNVDARSPLAEAYRQLRTSVLLSTAGRAPKSLLITSSLPGEGKTTTAVNVAYTLAQTGASVVVIDADMRRPRLHSIFDLDNRRGLSTILSSDMSEAEILAIIEQHETSGLHLLTSGPVPPNPAELIGSEQMRRLMSALESTFTHIIVDSPPVSSFTDGVLVASMVDGVLMVVHGGKSSRHVVKRSRQLLLDVGAKIFGVVLNNVDLRTHDYYYYQRYYQQSYYTAENESSEQSVSSTHT